ncbi:hypothetical protein EDB87DRAFT_1821485 [Lactarius vividus]|nr:hypothetical protein EDB87DRAFT_1821485 [Lactarius vividus]
MGWGLTVDKECNAATITNEQSFVEEDYDNEGAHACQIVNLHRGVINMRSWACGNPGPPVRSVCEYSVVSACGGQVRVFTYVEKHDLVNYFEQHFINISSDALFAALYGSPNAKGTTPAPEFAKREEALSALCKHMQPWYCITVPGDGSIVQKGALRSIRQGRCGKICTYITGFDGQMHYECAVHLRPRKCHVLSESSKLKSLSEVGYTKYRW